MFTLILALLSPAFAGTCQVDASHQSTLKTLDAFASILRTSKVPMVVIDEMVDDRYGDITMRYELITGDGKAIILAVRHVEPSLALGVPRDPPDLVHVHDLVFLRRNGNIVGVKDEDDCRELKAMAEGILDVAEAALLAAI